MTSSLGRRRSVVVARSSLSCRRVARSSRRSVVVSLGRRIGRSRRVARSSRRSLGRRAGKRNSARRYEDAITEERIELDTWLARDARGQRPRAMVHTHSIHNVGQMGMGTVEPRRDPRPREWRRGSEETSSRAAWSSSGVHAGDRGDDGDTNG
ncbi:hypothetical protein OAO87_01940 [bacterium]|nr:hypothetical protein [bacterium]